MTKIRNGDLSDHKDLIDLINEGIDIVDDIEKRFIYQETIDIYDIDIVKYCMYQLSMLKTAYQLIEEDKYIEIFIILRSVFEQHYKILLMSKGKKYAHDYFITEKDSDKRKIVFDGALKEIKKGIKNKKIDNVLDIIQYKYQKIRLIREGLFCDSDYRVIPAFYFEYIYHQPRKVFVDNLKTFKDLEPNGIAAKKWIDHHKKIYHKFIRFDTGVKDGLFINNEIDEFGWDRIIIHYNFLSLFTHIDNSILEEIEGKNKSAYVTKLDNYRKFNHYISELCLLYILRFFEYYFRLIFLHDSTSYTIKDIEELHDYVCRIVNKTRYLYFITDTPHELDIINFRTKGMYYKMITGKNSKANHIYYDNPLKRLEQIHTSFHELTTDDIFNSPFQ